MEVTLVYSNRGELNYTFFCDCTFVVGSQFTFGRGTHKVVKSELSYLGRVYDTQLPPSAVIHFLYNVSGFSD